jgi:sigma54-dependent transcription regulator
VDVILESLKKKIREYMNEGADHLASGGAQNMEEYNRMVGRIEGLAIIERDMIELEQKYIAD